MSATWRNLGLLIPAPVPMSWAVSHAALPVVDLAESGATRIYFSARDGAGRSRIAAVDLDLDAPASASYRPDPVLDLGPLGAFDDSGVTTACLVMEGGRKYLYYSGWSLGVSVPFYFYVGCAVSDDGGETWTRASHAPILERDAIDPYLTASPAVIIENGTWRMWYVSGTGWTPNGSRARHHYHVKYAESRDGIRWRRTGHVCIDYADEDEYAISRPAVVKDDDLYRMWFAARGHAYRICYAESNDGLIWRRNNTAEVMPSGDAWDTEMQAYPAVCESRGRRYLLYNGNGYGATGIGCAVLEEAA